LTADDESRQFVGWYDAGRSETCSFRASTDGVVRCLPTDVAEANFFADPACTQAIAALSACATPRYLSVVQPGLCTSDVRHEIHELGRRVYPAVVYLHSGASCARMGADPAVIYVAPGRVVPAVSFVSARYTTGRSSLSLKTEYQDGR